MAVVPGSVAACGGAPEVHPQPPCQQSLSQSDGWRGGVVAACHGFDMCIYCEWAIAGLVLLYMDHLEGRCCMREGLNECILTLWVRVQDSAASASGILPQPHPVRSAILFKLFYSAQRGSQCGMCRAAASSVVHQVVATIPTSANHSCCVLRILTHSTHTSAVHPLPENAVMGVVPILGGVEEA